MQRIMLILFSMAQVSESIDYSIKLATQHKAKLDVKFIIEKKIPETLSSLVMYTGFLGGKMSDEIEKTLLKEYQNRAEEVIKELKETAQENNIDISTEIVKNGSLRYCYKKIKEKKIDHLVLNYTRDKFVTEKVLDYYIDDFLHDLDIPYDVFYDGRMKVKL